MPEISVIMDNYNYGQYIGEAIRSVLSQDFSDFELIIVDDGSTDNSREIISSFPDSRIKKIFQENGGQLSAFNAGFQAATGKIVCFLDSDDLYQQGYLSSVAKHFSRYPDCGCLLCKIEYFGQKSGSSTFYPDGFFGCNPFSVAARHVWRGTSTSGISIKKDTLAKILPYTENEKYWKTRADDLLIWGTDIVCSNKYCFSLPAVKYRVHDNNSFFGRSRLSSQDYLERRSAAVQFCSWIMKRNNLEWIHLLEIENRNGNLSFFDRFLSWLKVGKSKMLPFGVWIKCGFVLICGYITGSSRQEQKSCL